MSVVDAGYNIVICIGGAEQQLRQKQKTDYRGEGGVGEPWMEMAQKEIASDGNNVPTGAPYLRTCSSI